VVFVLGTALGAVFTAAQSTATSDMGSTPILYAITVSFIAGGAAPLVVAAVAVGVGLLESLSIFLFRPQWSQVVVFACLLICVLVKVVRENMGAGHLKVPLVNIGPSGRYNQCFDLANCECKNYKRDRRSKQ
jgi:hypothetical protein